MLEGNGQPMTNDRLTTATTTALAACSPQAAAADLINQYVSSLGTFDPESIFDDDAFEAAILNRNDQYLDLLLSGGVRSEKHARLLWNRAVGAIESGDISYGESVKENLISAQGSYLINGDRYALGKNLTEIGREVFPSTGEITKLARVALRSEYNRALSARIVSKKFPIIESIEEPLLCIFWDEIASNKCINLDRTNSESPDLDAWAIKDGITQSSILRQQLPIGITRLKNSLAIWTSVFTICPILTLIYSSKNGPMLSYSLAIELGLIGLMRDAMKRVNYEEIILISQQA